MECFELLFIYSSRICFQRGSVAAGSEGLGKLPPASHHPHHHRRGVVAAGVFHGDSTSIFAGLVLAQHVHDLMVVEPIHQAVRAEQKDVAAPAAHRADLRIHKLVSAAERLLQDVAARMGARLVFVDFAVAEQPADMGVVLSELLDFVLPSPADDKSGCRRCGRNTSSPA